MGARRVILSVIAVALFFISAGCGHAGEVSQPSHPPVNSDIPLSNSVESVDATSPSTSRAELASLQLQVALLQKAVLPRTPMSTASAWAEAIKTRNGAFQFAILTPQLQAKMKRGYESWNWMPGASSPWVEKYSIHSPTKTGEGQYEFPITYTLTDSTNTHKTYTDRIKVQQRNGHWYVSDVGGYGASITGH